MAKRRLLQLRRDESALLATVDAAAQFVRDHGARASDDVAELMAELRTALEAARRVLAAVADDDPVGAYASLRVVLECTLRLRWVAGDDPEPDLAVIRQRLERQRRRDAMRLRAGLDYLPETPKRQAAIAAIDSLLATLMAAPAPAQLSGLATTPEGKMIYSGHRLCSGLIHPGIGIRRIDAMPLRDALTMAETTLDYATKIAASCAGILDRATGVDLPSG